MSESFFTTIASRDRIMRLKETISQAPGKLILMVWRRPNFEPTHSRALHHHTSMTSCHLLGVIGDNPVFSADFELDLPTDRYIIDDHLTQGKLSWNDAQTHGIDYNSLKDPGSHVYDIYYQQQGLSVYIGDERVGEWYIWQTAHHQGGISLSDLWLGCKQLHYRIKLPGMHEYMQNYRALIAREFARALIIDMSDERIARKIGELRERAAKYEVNLEFVYGAAQARLREILELDRQPPQG